MSTVNNNNNKLRCNKNAFKVNIKIKNDNTPI